MDVPTHNTSRNSSSFFVDFGTTCQEKNIESATSLQDRFKKFLLEKKIQASLEKEVERSAAVEEASTARSPETVEQLRQEFVHRAFHYLGVPYKRKYWTEKDVEYHAPLFLDCCGLVRRICWDMKEQLGFRLGPGNQAYMFDTLPEELDEDAMRPGDLVFISATYNNPKARPQKHNMVHVEIWLGIGPKTIGARWQNGKVQVFDSYHFEAKSFHSPVYHFRSITPWLKGVCRSYCPEHPWEMRRALPKLGDRFSIFNFNKTISTPDEIKDDIVEVHELQAGDTDDELVVNEELEQEKIERLLMEFEQYQ